jgi:hypothetical protein
MKSPTSLLILLTTFAAAPLPAAILTVDNNPGAVAQFNNFPAAYAAASNGDTILLAGSSSGYSGVIIYKRLNIVGPGYLLSENAIPGLSTNSASLNIDLGKDVLQGDASGSVITGVSVGTGAVALGMTGIRFEKCTGNISTASPCIVRASNLGNAQFGNGSQGSLISNCLIGGLQLSTTNLSATHCVVKSNFSAVTNTSISNSIFTVTSQASLSTASSITNCLSIAGAFLPAGGGNINGPVVIGNVFLNTGSDDARWQLAPGSPAIGTGTGGSNMGAFGGATPYVLSGVPGRPRLTRLVVPATATSSSGLQFEVDARAFTD